MIGKHLRPDLGAVGHSRFNGNAKKLLLPDLGSIVIDPFQLADNLLQFNRVAVSGLQGRSRGQGQLNRKSRFFRYGEEVGIKKGNNNRSEEHGCHPNAQCRPGMP